MSAPRPYGERMADKRARWESEGRCRDCGAPLDRPGSKKCARHRASRNRANYRKRGPGAPARGVDLVTVEVRMPADLYRRILADAADRDESVEAWLTAEARAALDADADAGEGEGGE